MNILQKLEARLQKQLIDTSKAVPNFRPGDTVKVNVRIVEGASERIQAYEGVCIARSNKGMNSNFTVRKISNGEGVERVFPLFSPVLESVTVIRRGEVRRAKLYYIRELTGKRARIREKLDYVEAATTEAPKA